MSSRAERKARANARRCRNCGALGPHYVGPGSGVAGVYMCQRNEQRVRSFGLTPVFGRTEQPPGPNLERGREVPNDRFLELDVADYDRLHVGAEDTDATEA